MSLVWPVVVGIALALALGGKLRRLGTLRLRAVWLFYAAFALKVVAFPFAFLPWHTPTGAARVLYVTCYATLGVAIALNARIPGVAIAAVGTALNLAAILANGGRMPALPSALDAAGLHFAANRNSVRAAHPHLPWLVDRWAAPSWVPWGNVFSVGDVVVSAGAVAFCLVATGALDRWLPVRRAEAVASAG